MGLVDKAGTELQKVAYHLRMGMPKPLVVRSRTKHAGVWSKLTSYALVPIPPGAMVHDLEAGKLFDSLIAHIFY